MERNLHATQPDPRFWNIAVRRERITITSGPLHKHWLEYGEGTALAVPNSSDLRPSALAVVGREAIGIEL